MRARAQINRKKAVARQSPQEPSRCCLLNILNADLKIPYLNHDRFLSRAFCKLAKIILGNFPKI